MKEKVSMGMDYHMIRLSPRDPPHFFLPLLSASLTFSLLSLPVASNPKYRTGFIRN